MIKEITAASYPHLCLKSLKIGWNLNYNPAYLPYRFFTARLIITGKIGEDEPIRM